MEWVARLAGAANPPNVQTLSISAGSDVDPAVDIEHHNVVAKKEVAMLLNLPRTLRVLYISLSANLSAVPEAFSSPPTLHSLSFRRTHSPKLVRSFPLVVNDWNFEHAAICHLTRRQHAHRFDGGFLRCDPSHIANLVLPYSLHCSSKLKAYYSQSIWEGHASNSGSG